MRRMFVVEGVDSGMAIQEAIVSRSWEGLISIHSEKIGKSVLAEAVRVYKDNAGKLRFVLDQTKAMDAFTSGDPDDMATGDDDILPVTFKVKTHTNRVISGSGHIIWVKQYDLVVDKMDSKDMKDMMAWVTDGKPVQ